MPWNLLNYALALSGIGWRAYFVASAAAVAPWAALFAHLGSLAASLADLFEDSLFISGRKEAAERQDDDGPFGEHTLLVTAAGAALAVAAASYVVFLARRELRRRCGPKEAPSALPRLTSWRRSRQRSRTIMATTARAARNVLA